MVWIILALLAAVTLAFQVEANRHFNCDGLRLNFWRALLEAVFLIIPCMLVPWPSAPGVYILAVVVGGGSVYACSVLFNMAARKQSRVSSLYAPLATLTGLLLWLAISSAEQQRMIETPVAGLIVFASLGIATYGLNHLRANDASWAALLLVAPVGLFYGTTDVLSRVVLTGFDMLPVVIVYGFVSSAASAAVNALALAKKGTPLGLDKQLFCASGCMALSSIAFLCTLTPAILLAPNPAYPGFFLMTMPVMLLAYHQLRGIGDDSNWRAAMFIVAGAVLASVQAVWFG